MFFFSSFQFGFVVILKILLFTLSYTNALYFLQFRTMCKLTKLYRTQWRCFDSKLLMHLVASNRSKSKWRKIGPNIPYIYIYKRLKQYTMFIYHNALQLNRQAIDNRNTIRKWEKQMRKTRNTKRKKTYDIFDILVRIEENSANIP